MCAKEGIAALTRLGPRRIVGFRSRVDFGLGLAVLRRGAMTDRFDDIEARLQRVEEQLSQVGQRLTALERGASPESAHNLMSLLEPAGAGASARAGVFEEFGLSGLPSLVGRTSIVLGGAYLLRAFMESGLLPRSGAVALGLGYALVWLFAADRAAGAGRAASALFHGMTALAIGFPLIWEASARFGFFGAGAGASLLGLLSGLALLVAWRRSLESLAAVATLGGIVSAIALAAEFGQAVPSAAFLVSLGAGTLWLSYDSDWHWLRWVPAIAADVLIGVVLVMRALTEPPKEAPDRVIAVQLALVAAYLVSFAARTILRGRTVIPFEIAQTAAVCIAGWGGALWVAHANGAGEAALGIASATIGLGCYAVAFVFIGRTQGMNANFYFYATLALVLVLTGALVLMERPLLALVLALLAVLASGLGSRYGRLALTLQGGVYGVAAALASGLVAIGIFSLLATPADPGVSLAFAPLTALLALLACLAIPAPSETASPAWLATVPRVVIGSFAVLGVYGTAVSALAPWLAGTPPEPGALATVRTGVLAGVAVLLATASRTERGREVGWLLYPVLALGGFKLLAEDLRFSRAATLFLALAFYGLALLAAPQLSRRDRPSEHPP
jgi:hypothetical protein